MDRYIRNPKDLGGTKHISVQDLDDYEQEKQIKEWLESEGRVGDYSFQHINRAGLPRNTLVRAQVRLDAKVQEDSSATFADVIAGSDGRDLECAGGDGPSGPEEPPPKERLDEKIDEFVTALGFKKETETWIRKTLLSSETLRQTRALIKDDWHLQTFLIDSE